jgi:plastocyanin
MKKLAVFSTLILLTTLAACGGGGSDTTKTKPEAAPAAGSAPAAGAAAAKPAAGPPGTVTGMVKYTGPAPRVIDLKMAADPYCDKANPGGAKRTNIEVGEGGAVAEVLVYVKEGLAGAYPPPSKAAKLDQHACNYSPRVIGLQVGQPLEIHNSDETLHNVHSLPENSKGFNLAMPMKNMTQTKKFTEPEVFVRFKCDVHPWMEAYVGVVDNPFFQVTGGDGKFTIEGLPPGTYTIEAAHPRAGRASASVTVASGATATANFELKGGE